jgi:hypothetical protein
MSRGSASLLPWNTRSTFALVLRGTPILGNAHVVVGARWPVYATETRRSRSGPVRGGAGRPGGGRPVMTRQTDRGAVTVVFVVGVT